MHERNEGKFLIQMHSQAKTSGTTLPEVHRIKKKLDPNLRPEKQHALPKKGETERLHIGQGRAGLRRKLEADCINPVHDRGINNDKSFLPDVPVKVEICVLVQDG